MRFLSRNTDFHISQALTHGSGIKFSEPGLGTPAVTIHSGITRRQYSYIGCRPKSPGRVLQNKLSKDAPVAILIMRK
jgi:hypothetical protein